MGDTHLRILLIEDSPGDARLLREMLAEPSQASFAVVPADRMAAGLDRLGESEFDLVLLDLSLPDSEGLDTLRRVHGSFPSVPIVVLTGLNDEQLAVRAVREGAQDYLVKGQIDRQVLVRAIHYARERHRLTATLRSLALFDDLTGLYNRRGFVTIAEEQLKLARRTGQGMAVAFIDLNGMKSINDSLGHEAGDRALIAIAGILKSTFRNSDVIGRLGGDEFVALTIGVDADAVSRLLDRLQETLARHNEQPAAAPSLSFSVGVAHYDPASSISASIDELIAEADQAMYIQKQHHRAGQDRLGGGGPKQLLQ